MRHSHLILAATLAITPLAAASAATPREVDVETVDRDDDGESDKWGLLGLLGLAGLLGLKRDERRIHVDARKETQR